jgi:lysophospholipase L1-like esterase
MRSLCGLASVFILYFAWAAHAQDANNTPRQSPNWVGSWASSQQIPEPRNTIPSESLHNVTLRQIVRLSIGGSEIRVRISNAFGTSPLHCVALHVARSLSAATSRIDPGSDRALTFNGSSEFTIPAGAEYFSDPLYYVVPPESDLTVTMYLNSMPEQETGHPGSRATSWLAHGSLASAIDLPNAQTVEHWYFLSGIDMEAPANASAIVALGDSITDGHASTTNGNDRWTDDLARRLLKSSPETSEVSVLNAGIGGNRLLGDGLGPNALARLDRDVLTQNGIRYLVVLEGVNDLGTLTRDGPATNAAHSELVRQIIESYVQIITQAHTHGLKVIGGTIMPFAGSNYYHPGPATEADRQSVNAWIRTSGHFDAVVDFDRVMADPARPDHLRPGYDCGDHLHPSPTGYNAMANAIPLNLFGMVDK